MEISGKTFLVVGGSGALGGELTRQLHAAGATVLATASSNETAGNIPAVATVRLLLDYRHPESIATLTDYLLASDTPIDAVINAGGVVAFGPASELSPESLAQLFAVNALGPIQLVSALLPALEAAGQRGAEPVFVNLTGVVAEAPMPSLAAYSASKTAIYGFTQAVSREWRRAGVRVVDARPGHTETGLATRAISGTAPNFPEGMTTLRVATRIMNAIREDEKDLPSTAF